MILVDLNAVKLRPAIRIEQITFYGFLINKMTPSSLASVVA